MEIKLTLVVPFYNVVLDSLSSEEDLAINFRNTKFKLVVSSKNANKMTLVITWYHRDASANYNLQEIAEKGIEFINFMIYHARTFVLQTSKVVLISPRNTKNVTLTISDEKGKDILTKKINLSQKPEGYFEQYLEILNEPGSYDEFYYTLNDKGDEEVQLLQINLLVMLTMLSMKADTAKHLLIVLPH